MDAEMRARSRAMSLDEVWKWTVGGGILLVALAPLSLPIIILTIAAILPLVVPLLALGLVVALVAVPVVLLRKAGRSLRRVRPTRPRPEPPAEGAPKPAASH